MLLTCYSISISFHPDASESPKAQKPKLTSATEGCQSSESSYTYQKQLYTNVLAAGLEQVCVFDPRVSKNAGFAQHTYSEELRILLLSFETWLFLPSFFNAMK